MVDKWYRDLTPEEKAKTLLLGNDAYAFFHSDPETCIDTQGCASPITAYQAFEIVNDELVPLWFKVEAAITTGDPTKWLDLAKEMFVIEGHIVPSVKNADVWASHLTESIKEGLHEALIARKGEETVGFIEWSYPTIPPSNFCQICGYK